MPLGMLNSSEYELVGMPIKACPSVHTLGCLGVNEVWHLYQNQWLSCRTRISNETPHQKSNQPTSPINLNVPINKTIPPILTKHKRRQPHNQQQKH